MRVWTGRGHAAVDGAFLRGLRHGLALAMLLWAILGVAAWGFFGGN